MKVCVPELLVSKSLGRFLFNLRRKLFFCLRERKEEEEEEEEEEGGGGGGGDNLEDRALSLRRIFPLSVFVSKLVQPVSKK